MFYSWLIYHKKYNKEEQSLKSKPFTKDSILSFKNREMHLDNEW